MSVFKLHEALAVAHELDSRNQSLDSIMTLQRSQLSETTWSPMLKDYPKGDLKISVGELMRYILTVSDNNASNVLFDSIVSVSHTDSFIRNLGIPDSFRLQYTESQMQRDHAISYDNYSSPSPVPHWSRECLRIVSYRRRNRIPYVNGWVSASVPPTA